MTFTLPSISSSFEFWSVNHTSIYENSELVVLKNVTFLEKYLVIEQIICYSIPDTSILLIFFVDNITMD